MAISERAGRPADPSILVDVDRLLAAYLEAPDPSDPTQRVAFGTSGHRGSSLNGAFNEAHIAATTEAICRYRASQGTVGPLFIGKDTHALSEPAFETALRGLVAHGVDVRVDIDDGYTPTPVISHAILVHNRGARATSPTASWSRRRTIRPRTAASSTTRRTAGRPTPTSRAGSRTRPTGSWRRASTASGGCPSRTRARRSRPTTTCPRTSTISPPSSTWMPSAASGLRLGVDPLGGASVAYWPRIGERYALDLTVTNAAVDPRFAFMTCDWDGRIRMDPSSPYAMARLVELRDRFDVAFGNDTDADRHGIVTPGGRPAEPEPLPGGVGRSPVRWRARLGRRTSPSARPWSARP